jgi:hypothetical protein
MRTKYFLIYVFVGIAFLAVSAWVFLSGGQNAKAIRAKYKLGGILILAWAMISVASCTSITGIVNGGEMVECYDPVEPEPTENIVELKIKSSRENRRYNEITAGDIVSIRIKAPTRDKYVLLIYLWDNEAKQRNELQRAELIVEDPENAVFEVPVSESIEYRGEAWLDVYCVVNEDPEQLESTAYGTMIVYII